MEMQKDHKERKQLQPDTKWQQREVNYNYMEINT